MRPEHPFDVAIEADRHEKSKIFEFKDSVFGLLKLDQQFDYFQANASFRGTAMNVSFETDSVDELKELIKHAKPLWRKRQAWFSAWRKNVYRYYMANLADEWWQGGNTRTERTFYRFLGWPVGVRFYLDKGQFCYSLGGWSEELFTDHGIDASGSSLSKMEVLF